MTAGLLTSSRTKTKLFKRKLQQPTDLNILKYKNYLNNYNKIKRAMKTKYYCTIIEDNKYNIKTHGTFLNLLLEKKMINQDSLRSSI